MNKVKIDYLDGSSYEGYYSIEKDHFQDFGILEIRNDNWKVIYEGNFHRGLFNKNGILKINGEYLYEGEFKKNMKNGFGKERKGNHFIYEGQFYKNFKEGIGKLITRNNIIKGNFKKNEMHGICEIYFITSKNIYKGKLYF